jgi:acetyl esterase/lipase
MFSRSPIAAPRLALAFSIWFGGAAGAQDKAPAPPADIKYEIDAQADIVYGRGGDADLKLDLFTPKGATGPLAAVVFIHGGGWSGGNKESFAPFALKLAAEGVVTATISYRLAPKHVFPAQIEDCKCAVRWLRANAERLHIDPERIGALGGSAGGHLALMLGVLDATDGLEGEGGSKDHSSKVQAVVSFVGPTNLVGTFPETSTNILKNFLGGPYAEKSDLYRQASPITYVTKGDPPFLLFQGTEDVLVPYDQAFQFTEAMQKASVPGEVVMHVGLGHGWGGAEMDRDVRQSFDFLKAKLEPAKKK